MSLFNVSDSKDAQLILRMLKLGVREEDIVEQFIKGSGPGGQKVNKTSSCVHIIHRPSGIEIKCQRGRSQSLNRFLARRELCDRIENRILGALSKRQQAIEKIRRQKRRRSRRQKDRMLRDKHHHSEKKSNRKHVSADN